MNAQNQPNTSPVGADLRVCPDYKRHEHTLDEHTGSPLQRVIQWFKTMTTNEYIRGVGRHGWTPFSGKLWQRNYYEHIIRDEKELTRIRNSSRTTQPNGMQIRTILLFKPTVIIVQKAVRIKDRG